MNKLTTAPELEEIVELVPPKLVLAGRPFAGKDEHGGLLADALGYKMTVASQALKEHASRFPDSKEAIEIVTAKSEARLASDAVTIAVMRDRLLAGQGINEILNGFPRNKQQFDALQDVLRELGMAERDICIFLNITPQAAAIRMAENNRGRPEDDTPDKLIKRNVEFDNVTMPVVGAYEGAGRLVIVNIEEHEALAPVAEIQLRIKRAVRDFVLAHLGV